MDIYDPKHGIAPSAGNGSAMKIGACANAYNKFSKTMHTAKILTIPSHPHKEGVKGAQAEAAAIYMARAGRTKEEIKAVIETMFDYNLDIGIKVHQEYYKNGFQPKSNGQSEVCPTTVPQSISVILQSMNYEDALREATSMGGDSDTIGIMVGNIAGPKFGMPDDMAQKCLDRLDDKAMRYLDMFQNFINSRNVEPDQEELDMIVARAKLESYVLQEAKKGHNVIPKNDSHYLDLLADMEGTRLLYEQIEKAEQEKDTEREKYLRENKKTLLTQMTDYLKKSPEFLKGYNKMSEPQTKMVPVKDWDKTKRTRVKGYVPPYPTEVQQVKHEMIPQKMLAGQKSLDDIRFMLKSGDSLADSQKDLNSLKRTTLFSSNANSTEMQAVKDNLDVVLNDHKNDPDNKEKLIQDLFTLKRSTDKYITSHSNQNARWKQVNEIGSLAEKKLKEQDPLEVIETLAKKLGGKANSKTMEKFQSSLENFRMAKESKDPKTIKNAMDRLEFFARAYTNDHSNHNERYDIVDTIRKIADNYILTKGKKVSAKTDKNTDVKNNTQQKKSGLIEGEGLIGDFGLNVMADKMESAGGASKHEKKGPAKNGF